ncbi:tRNA-binding protein [Dyadobacter tibetensis]|uniref:tRNA-binding protein n=1 Tax=Dyadobacter tibetensis TaxID=1211851 RepID=UPI0004708549|nr:tRNA-binding protein [Dyadobacter tibetensis]
MNNEPLTWQQFEQVEMRVGTILTAQDLKGARKPAYELTIDFGTFGIRKSSAQITKRYNAEALIGQQIIAVLNFPPKQIATIMSECLVLGAIEADQLVTLLKPGMPVENGTRIG